MGLDVQFTCIDGGINKILYHATFEKKKKKGGKRIPLGSNDLIKLGIVFTKWSKEEGKKKT